ncbi:hypothetical protein SAMN05444722_2420 [Rhodovulum sp. ES.010]|uniref:hypothetical protein n=1 Tax=Rhodovulum sp. ES.010 TaxID=1882821 RepID=UPI000929590F|nr:hypothetical protein [Rhodovulum sp. ES.010]SIO47504.1 hypothetical protein SAMN05444722_2420 [Rhodovulum sp. ES.010]
MDEKDAYRQKIQARLDQWRAEIDKLQAKAVEAGADARVEYDKQIEKLRARQAEAQDRLDELDSSRGEAWKDLKSGIEKAWNELESAVKSAANRFS